MSLIRLVYLMANNKTLHKAIERCDKRIAQAKNKLRWSRTWEDKDAAQATIDEQESKKLVLRQQIAFNVAVKHEQRIKKAKGTEPMQTFNESRSGCDSLGVDCPW